ncbi:hypothetical protein [Micromonospora endophytica]|uniref:Uncharacterized protein n=1 Tax=Micromonospora endophytica TaxID=515350 RepID=A0A2W2E2F8_9ACTN|nr:hypothetical protein [Micromonospora endophytica]PZF99133.1 hypothetical protein C1I93_06660 [Micromonospora endophytica]RIW48238.1 hypothetical protein D3H59_07860 [Micromonospora endophytica]BCJ56706.1 hypothetical protein Jiend_01280 [Micromonospora endophytica]
MSDDLDQRLTATLQRHAGGSVDPTPLVAQARLLGRRSQRRRRGLAAGGALAACAALAVAVVALPPGPAPDGPAGRLALPQAPGTPGASARPEAVGTDPGIVHFTTEALVSSAETATWRAGRGVESVEFQGPSGAARFALARSVETLDQLQQTLSSAGQPQPPVDVRVGARPGTAWFDKSDDRQLWFVRWQPVDGLWAQLDSYAADRDEATATATLVRFDQAQRCVVPFRLEALPTGGRLLECSVTLHRVEPTPVGAASLVVGDDSGRWLTVRTHVTPGYEAPPGDLVAGPYRARRQGSEVLEMVVEPYVVEAFLRGWGKGYPESVGLTVLGGFQGARDPARPDTW